MNLETFLSAHERLPHQPHQLEGTRQLVLTTDEPRGRVIPSSFGLLDEVGGGKTKQCIDAAQILFSHPQLDDMPVIDPIDTVLALTPGFARSTWADEDPLLGEVAKHAWTNVPNIVHEFHSSYTDLDLSDPGLHWVVSNYEFIRRDERRDELLWQLRGRRTWLIVDESWCVKGNSDQTRACIMIRRKRAERATILNGTPLSDGKPMDLYYQFALLDPGIINVKNVTHFRSKYCIMGGFNGKTIVDYKDLDDLNRRIAPYILARKTRDSFPLPPMLPPLVIEARMTDDTWKIYREMRDEMVTWLGQQVSMSKQGIVKALRLSQICAGFLGGLESIDPLEDTPDEDADPELGTQPTTAPLPAWLKKTKGIVDQPLPFGGPFDFSAPPVINASVAKVTKEVGREKLDQLIFWLTTLEVIPDRMIFWCRFRPELERLTTALKPIFGTVMNLKGGQSPEERREVKKLLAPGSKRKGAVVGIVGTGAASLNFAGANVMIFVSNSPALIKRTQSIGRIERPGQTLPMTIGDVIAAGPRGQKTIDHKQLAALKNKDDMARWTVDQWRKILAEE